VIGLGASLLIIFVPWQQHVVFYLFNFLLGLASSGQALTFAVVEDNYPKDYAGPAIGFNNMCAILGGLLMQPLIGKLLDMNWAGKMIHGERFYRVDNFQNALAILPLFFFIAAVVSIFFIRETNCKEIYPENEQGE